MTRLKKTIRNLLMIVILIPFFMSVNGLYLSSVKALHTSEKDLHYGPSEIVHSFEQGNVRYFLGRYENYINLTPIKRSLGIFWRYGGGYGIENHLDRQLSTGYRSDEEQLMLYGIRNDTSIAWLEVVMEGSDGEVRKMKVDEFYEDLFYVIWEFDDESTLGSYRVESKILAYDAEGEVVYEVLF